MRSGGRVEINKAAKILLTEFRDVVLGTISLETPEMCMKEQIAVDEKVAQKLVRDAQRKTKYRQRTKR